MDDPEYKIITLGDVNVGKTSILKKYVYKKFDNVKNTIGINILFQDIILKNKKTIKLKLFDTAGSEKYKSLSKQYFKNADGVLFVFSFDEPDSFSNIEQWIHLYNDTNSTGKSDIPKYLIGNKNDLEHLIRQEDIDKFLKENKEFKYMSMSAKNDDNNIIIELFQDIGERIYKNQKDFKNKKGKSIKLSTFEEKKRGCLFTQCI